jgi:putative ABC transport system substrate-binding protein
MTQDSDPVANGFVASLARPGGNISGLSTLAPELSGKEGWFKARFFIN